MCNISVSPPAPPHLTSNPQPARHWSRLWPRNGHSRPESDPPESICTCKQPCLFLNSPFCNCKSRRVQVPVPTAVYGDGDASRTGREAAGLRSLLPASVCQELVQGWWRSQESGSERTLRRNGDEATPAENPGGLADSSRGTCCTRTGKEANKGGSFLSPTSAHFESENDEATASVSVDLGPARVVVSSVMWAAISGHRADERGVHGTCHSGRPLQTTSMRRTSWTAHRCSWRPARRCARLAPRLPGRRGRWRVRGAVLGRRARRMPDVEHAARWSPYASSTPRQEQLRGPSGRVVGNTVKARAA